MSRIIFLLIFYTCCCFTLSFSQVIKWYSWEEVQALQHEEERKVLVNIGTRWCKVCKKMNETTFQHPDIISYINENYYPIMFDAQDKRDIELKGKTFSYRMLGARGGYNELAYKITHGHLVFPTLVFMDTNFRVLQAIDGYQNADRLKKIATYFALDYHQTTPWRVYADHYDDNSSRNHAIQKMPVSSGNNASIHRHSLIDN